jgi:CcmD family protein
MDNIGFLFAANLFVWAAIFFYVFTLIRRNDALKKDIELLKEVVRKETRK